MPDPVPSTSGSPKKLNKTGVILIVAGGAVIAYLIFKKKQESAGSNPYTNQAFIPVTGENVSGAGAPFTGSSGGSSGGSGEFISLLEQSQKENQQTMIEFLRQGQERERESRQSERELFEHIVSGVGSQTGGGAPSSGQSSSGAGTASPPSGGSSGSPPPPPHAVSKCSGSYPYSGSHGCYRNITCPNGCQGHDYQHGATECQQGERKRGNCHW